MPRTLSRHLLLLTAILLCGCASQRLSTSTPTPHYTAGLHGLVHGGNQPVSGATIQLYAVGATADGSDATPLLHASSNPSDPAYPLVTDTNGNFTITNLYTCPTPTTLVYLLATGGNPGLTDPLTNNTAIAMITLLGQCQTLATLNFAYINEVTTVAAVTALAPYIASPTAIGSSPSDASALATAFTLASQFVDIGTGATPGVNVPTGLSVPTTQINTLADIISACINTSGGAAGSATLCGSLFTDTTAGTVPTDVVGALLNIANNPSQNIAELLDLLPASPPFQPTLLTPPPDWSVALYTTTPALTVSPSHLTFPTTTVAFPSASQTLTLTNSGATSIDLTGFHLVGADFGDFSLTNVNCTTPLTAFDSCDLNITFTPTDTGLRYAFVSIANSSTVVPIHVALIGTGAAGTAGPVTLLPSSLSFTQVGIPQTLTLSNNGTTPLHIAGIVINRGGTPYGYLQTNTCGTVVAASSSCTITVSATNLYGGPNTTGITVIDDATPSNMQTASLSTNSSVTFDGTPVDYGTLAVGTYATHTFGVVSSPGTPVAFSVSSITGTNAADFVGTGSCSDTFTCSLPIYFYPGAIGTRTATLVTSLGNIPVTGAGVGAGAGFSISNPDTSAFQNVGVGPGGTSSRVSFNISNTGTTQLHLSTSFSGPNASDFQIAPNGNGCSSILSSGPSSCTMVLTFTPTAVGPRSATWTVTDSNSGLQHSITLNGSGIYEQPTTTPGIVNIFNIPVGTTSAPTNLTVSQVDGHPVSINFLSGSDPAGFALSTTTCSSTPCIVGVTFTPAAAISYASYVKILDLISGRSITLTLQGTGGHPVVSLSTTSLTFPLQPHDTNSTPQTVTLTNTGDRALSITRIDLTATNDFGIPANTCGNNLNAGASCTVSVTYGTNTIGNSSSTANLEFLTNASTSPDLVSLSGSSY